MAGSHTDHNTVTRTHWVRVVRSSTPGTVAGRAGRGDLGAERLDLVRQHAVQEAQAVPARGADRAAAGVVHPARAAPGHALEQFAHRRLGVGLVRREAGRPDLHRLPTLEHLVGDVEIAVVVVVYKTGFETRTVDIAWVMMGKS